eukprot:CAMPEP_0185725936 /NCGR_PEP_ID=MMETSP1171-20130828/2059_1 /TAXON_ID=374046 /ORGANISM="Helicotheca tamensis, Strain CCMP826" /LENGTH=500 /DNA_ID=CAMNT_0028394181 /DNA_START=94 /DNA_END=1596 /DNA_ORIENTATION=-
MKQVVLLVLLSVAIVWNDHAVHSFTVSTTSRRRPSPLRVQQQRRASSSSLYSSVTASRDDDVCTIQILMSDTGGGHRASANALRDAFDVLHPGKIEVDIVDIYTDYGPFFPYNSYVEGYKIMAEYSFLWKAFFEFGETPFGLWLNDFLLELFCFEPFKKCLDRPSCSTNKRADMVVSVHPLCQELPLKILSSLDTNGKTRKPEGRTTPFATVVTDLGGAHPTWFNPGVDKCFVPSDALYQKAQDRNVKPEQLIQYGLPIRKGFWSDTPKTSTGTTNQSWFARTFGQKEKQTTEDSISKNKVELRNELGLKQSIPTVLVVGGGDGMGGIIEQAKSLGTKLHNDAPKEQEEASYQMVVICGKNEKAQATLTNEKWGHGVNVLVKGFVNNMDEYMRASDAIVTKAGPGTIAEASICGLPCMLSSFLPGQEEGNVPYVENSGFGSYSGNPTVIAEKVSSWLASPELMSEMKANALKAARPSATLDIAKDLAQMVFEHKNKPASA